ncbi:MAG: sortase [Ruminococcaceae bacterium]|nr:sortase [Oscillospiraceae bacterium]MBE6996429.1 sortase [Oscillospiraceae bacterium]
MSRKIRGIFLITLGLLMSVSAAVIFARYEYQAEIAGANAEILLDALEAQIQQRVESSRHSPAKQENPTAELPKTTIQPEASERPQATLEGYELVGIVRVPSLGLELPVLDSWDYDLLKIAPCRYSGSTETGDLILLAHNYERHFGTLKKAQIGTEVEFCDVNGTVYRYEIAAAEILKKTELDRLTSSDYDLTLFTCTNGGYSRYVVRCTQVSAPIEAGTPAPGVL